MILEETITVSEKEIVERAIELLAKHKHLIFKLEQCETGLFCNSSIRIVVSDLTLTDFNEQAAISVLYEVFREHRADDEPKNICFNDIVALRIAKILFDWHRAQEQKHLENAVNNICGDATSAPLRIAGRIDPKDLSTSASISISGYINELSALKQKVKDLENINKQLIYERDYIRVILKEHGICNTHVQNL